MTSSVLLDTCALIWLVNGAPMETKAKSLIEAAGKTASVFVNPMSSWEVGMLVSKNRLSLTMTVSRWFKDVLDHPAFNLGDLNITTLIESTELPGSPPSDPVDRMMIALSRESGMPLVTRDRKIIDYSNKGHLNVILC